MKWWNLWYNYYYWKYWKQWIKIKIKKKKIINNEELLLENILDTINEEENYNKLVLTLKRLSERSNTIKKTMSKTWKESSRF